MRNDADKAFKRNSAIIVGAIALGLGLAGLLSFLLLRSILGALSAAVNIADRIASGELGNNVRVGSQDELGSLLDSLRRMDYQARRDRRRRARQRGCGRLGRAPAVARQ